MAPDTPTGNGLSLRDLILEVRADIRGIDAKLENKADRQRVHDLANEVNVIKLERAAEKSINAEAQKDLRDAQDDARSLRTWLWRLTISVAVVSLAVGTNLSRLYLGL